MIKSFLLFLATPPLFFVEWVGPRLLTLMINYSCCNRKQENREDDADHDQNEVFHQDAVAEEVDGRWTIVNGN